MKIGYLVDESCGWGGPAEWKFYPEKDLPEYVPHKLVKRIAYFEVDEE